MAYSELIKNFQAIRDYMRQFYVYGFKSREQYNAKSARSYDNEKRRLESWLGDYMTFRQEENGKNVFLSVDSRRIPENPLHKAFKAKSFTDRDVTLHFYILDILQDGEKTAGALVDEMEARMQSVEEPLLFDESTVRKKLKEYEKLGLLESEKRGREVFYRRRQDAVDLDAWADAAAFFSEEDPMGVVGSYLLDKLEEKPRYFRFKHHYILHALDTQILHTILLAIDKKRAMEITVKSLRSGREKVHTVCPLKIYVSVQSGRQYLLGYHYRRRHLDMYRIDTIRKVEIGNLERQYGKYLAYAEAFDGNLWGISTGGDHNLDHIEMDIRVDRGEEFILQRLEREKRHGSIEMLDDHTCRFTAEVYDASEMMPWIRTFIGRIVALRCSSDYVTRVFYDDLAAMKAMYGGDTNAVP